MSKQVTVRGVLLINGAILTQEELQQLGVLEASKQYLIPSRIAEAMVFDACYRTFLGKAQGVVYAVGDSYAVIVYKLRGTSYYLRVVGTPPPQPD